MQVHVKEGVHQNFILSWGKELCSLKQHCTFFLGLSCFFHKPEKFRKQSDEILIGENIGPNVKVLVPDMKILVPDVKVLVLGCGFTGPWMCQIWSGNAAGKVRTIFETNKCLRLIVQTKLQRDRSYEFLVEYLFKLI